MYPHGTGNGTERRVQKAAALHIGEEVVCLEVAAAAAAAATTEVEVCRAVSCCRLDLVGCPAEYRTGWRQPRAGGQRLDTSLMSGAMRTLSTMSSSQSSKSQIERQDLRQSKKSKTGCCCYTPSVRIASCHPDSLHNLVRRGEMIPFHKPRVVRAEHRHSFSLQPASHQDRLGAYRPSWLLLQRPLFGLETALLRHSKLQGDYFSTSVDYRYILPSRLRTGGALKEPELGPHVGVSNPNHLGRP